MACPLPKLTASDLVRPLENLRVRDHHANTNHPPALVDNKDEAQNFIMDAPVLRMGRVEDDGRVVKREALGLNLPEMYEEVKKACEKLPGPREKPLLAIMRGSGGGKTRALTELWWYVLLNCPHMLPLTITFNNTTPAGKERGLLEGADADTRVCLSVAFRILHSLFDIQFTDLLERLGPVVKGRVAAESILGELLACACDHVNRARGQDKPQVTHAVLMVDEAARLAEFHTEPSVGDTLRRGILDFANTNFKLALVVSSLSTSLVAKTASGRSVWPLHIPEALVPKEVVERWWRLDPNSLALEWLAAAVSTSPRAAECALAALGGALPQGCNNLTLEGLKDAWLQVEEKIIERYGYVSVPVEMWCKAVFGETVGLFDDHVKAMLIESVFVNAPTSFGEHEELVPKLSAAMLHRMQTRSQELTLLVQAVTKRIFDLPEKPNEGSLLEACMREWLPVLLLSAVLRQPVPLKALLGLSERSIPHLEHAIQGFSYETSDIVKDLNSNAEHDRLAFVDALSGFVVNDPVMFATHPLEAFDGMVAMRAGESDEVHVILFECKARRVKSPAPHAGGSVARIHNRGGPTPERQAANVHRLAQLCRKRENLEQRSVAEALAAGRWTMVYVDNDKKTTLHPMANSLDRNAPPHGNEDLVDMDMDAKKACAGYVVRLGDEARERFFGPLHPLYCSLRAAFDNKMEHRGEMGEGERP